MFFLLLMFTIFVLYVVHTCRMDLIEMLEHGRVDEALALLKLDMIDIPGVNKGD